MIVNTEVFAINCCEEVLGTTKREHFVNISISFAEKI